MVGLDALVVVTALPAIHRLPGASLAGALSDRVGRRPLLVSGMLVQAASFVWFARLASASVEYWRLAIPMALIGIGVAMVLPVAPTAMLSAAQREDMGKASGVNSTVRRFGGVGGARAVASAASSPELGAASAS